ncbi:MAG TPA: hypothetical protein VF395_01075, partial [Polyangiaceae bacterium]
MTSRTTPTELDRRLMWSVFALLLVSYAYFFSGGGWNENSRFDLVRSIVDDHTLAIDRYHENTGDKARHGEHYYSDKAPGLSFLAVPAYALVRLTHPFFRTEHDFVVFAVWLVTCLTISVAGAATGALVYRCGRQLGASSAGALLAALAYGLGTPAFPLSTMLFGHQLAALILMSAFLLATGPRDENKDRSTVIVLLCAAAAVVEYPTFPVALGIALFHLGPRFLRLSRPARFSRPTWKALLIAAVPVVALGIYLTVAFGSPLRVGYDLLSDPGSRAEMHSHGFFGVSYPKLAVIGLLLGSHTRGLLIYSPVLFLAFPGFLEALFSEGDPERGISEEDRRRRRTALLALSVVVYFVLFVSSYEWWAGGASFGSRHLAPMLPFLALPVALVASRRPWIAIMLLVPSVMCMTVVTAVHPKPSDWVVSPFWNSLLPSFLKGDLALTKLCPVFGNPAHPDHHPFATGAPYDAFNVGMLLGGRGLKTLVPLVALWTTAVWAFARELREPAATDVTIPA